MTKITEITEKKYRTKTIRDEDGNRSTVKVKQTFKREVQTIFGWPRLLHFIIDRVIFSTISFGIGIIVGIIGVLISGSPDFDWTTLDLLLNFSLIFLYFLYYFVCEAIWQRTPGKFITKSIVIDEYGNKPSVKQIAIRTISRFVPFEPLSCIGSPSYGWHDKWAKTFVVTQKELEELKRLQKAKESENNYFSSNNINVS